MKRTKVQTFETQNKPFRVGVISDTQLPPFPERMENDVCLNNLKKALTVLKNRKTDLILFAGDIGDLGTRFAFQLYADAFDEVFGSEKPIVQTIMGNHDYWNLNAKTAIRHKKAFREIVGQSPWTHYAVNGYHFIGASPNCGSMTRGYRRTVSWLRRELKKAEADSKDKPIFVMTHNQPKNTSYGSEDWGDVTLHSLFAEYPNLVNFSGHVHYPLLDERSVWQGEYTVFNTQSLSYTEMEKGKENGTIPPNADKTPMGYLLEFEKDAIAVRRLNFADGETGREEKADSLWTLPLPYGNDGRYSFEKRKKANHPPVIRETKGEAAEENGKVCLTFPAAKDDDFVHSYKVVIDGKKTKTFFSDFYNGLTDMSRTVSLTLDAPKGKGVHTYEIFALDSWGAESDACVLIQTE